MSTLEDQLSSAQEHRDQFQAMSQANEEALQEMTRTAEEVKASLESQLQAIKVSKIDEHPGGFMMTSLSLSVSSPLSVPLSSFGCFQAKEEPGISEDGLDRGLEDDNMQQLIHRLAMCAGCMAIWHVTVPKTQQLL